jgi:hypothetical protein
MKVPRIFAPVPPTCRVLMVCLLVLASANRSPGYVLNVNSLGNTLQWQLVPPYGWTSNTVFNPQTKAIRFYMAEDAYSTANRQAELNAVRASFAQWQYVPGTKLKFEEGGLVPASAHSSSFDNTNLVFWTKYNNLIGYDEVSGAVAISLITRYVDENLMAECDIILNGVDYAWSADINPPLNVFSIEPNLIHEIGHLIGLEHSPVGGAVMMPFGESGVESADGLTADEIAAARSVYPDPVYTRNLAILHGYVTKNNSGVLGAVVLIENLQGTVIASTLSRQNGFYEIASLAPGNYKVRVTPLDAPPSQGSTGSSLIWGYAISADFGAADTVFLPSTPVAITLSSGVASLLNLPVASGNPALRITRFLPPVTSLSSYLEVNTPIQVKPRQSGIYIGVYSPNLPVSGATFTVTGDGLTLGEPQYFPGLYFPGVGYLNLIAASIQVSATATPGLRNLIVQKDSDIAYANGFLIVMNPAPDVNYDGLNDLFQRQYFSWFLAPEAAPDADPDADGLPNWAEYAAGTNPLDNISRYLQLRNARLIAGRAVITWNGVYGQKYQVLARDQAAAGTWQILSPILKGWGETLERSDTQTPAPTTRFYRLQALK